MDLKLLQWTTDLQDDLIQICNAVDRRYLSNRMPYPYTAKDAAWWLGMVKEHDGKDSIFRAIVVDGNVAGTISVEGREDVHCRDSEIGYFLLTEYHSRGLMTEAVRQICSIAFSKLNILRITGLVYSPNIASQKVLLKNHFVLEGTQRKAIDKNGEVYDSFLYCKLKP